MKRFSNILCVVELDKASTDALKRAVTIARNSQAQLTVAAVAETVTAGIETVAGGPDSRELQKALVKAHTQRLETMVDPYRAQIEIETRVLVGVSYLAITRDVMQSSRDLVVKAPENPEWSERLFGSNDMHLMRKCPCPVWMVKPHAEKPYRRILAAVDAGNDHPPAELATRHTLNLQVLEMASYLALSEFAELHVACAWVAIGERLLRGGLAKKPEKDVLAYVEDVRLQYAAGLKKLLDETASTLGKDGADFIKQQTHLVKGLARKEIPALARDLQADLVVMGTVARTGIPGFFMGNTAETILEQLHCSVLAIKPPGFITPVTLVD